ncbi:DUF2946 domain-containing protein [Bradyrhizobium sediminis]|uniref:DUF2946 domain-containing protein n=1 Tax=Bradyrhizobium sediminis TaxID=2840469 RepID=A0A975RW68_9BRAD|nr:DUF2946 family protein [Bradyrhizobium sediminis]QWG22425.1 DUF2946 domain-containing protein [Bradyrhizobium sediminis]
MKWFRSNIKHGSRLALLALALQFVLPFGHFHEAAAQTVPTIQSVATQSDITSALVAPDAADSTAQPASHPEPDRQSGDACAVCAVIALANSALFATPPILLLPQAVEFLHLTTDAEFIHLNSASAAFQPRAPPAS